MKSANAQNPFVQLSTSVGEKLKKSYKVARKAANNDVIVTEKDEMFVVIGVSSNDSNDIIHCDALFSLNGTSLNKNEYFVVLNDTEFNRDYVPFGTYGDNGDNPVFVMDDASRIIYSLKGTKDSGVFVGEAFNCECDIKADDATLLITRR